MTSIDTGLTISKVRTAKFGESVIVVASSYEGVLFAMDYAGRILWHNVLTGFMNCDLWCGDITGDGNDEILTGVSSMCDEAFLNVFNPAEQQLSSFGLATLLKAIDHSGQRPERWQLHSCD